MSRWSEPTPVTDLDLAFPARGEQLTPKIDEIPPEFHNGGIGDARPWVELATGIFASDIDQLRSLPVDGVDPKAAYRHLRCVIGTYATKHQRKEAAAAWLLSQWFQAATWTVRGQAHQAGHQAYVDILKEHTS